jgi:AcrR family transcriptional regulator
MKRDDIVAAGLAEFSNNDYEAASVNAIIEQSGTSKGTFYHHFPSKEALYFELIQQVADAKVRFMQSLNGADRSAGTGDTLFDLLRSQMAASVRFSAAYPQYALFSARVANETSQRVRNKIDTLVGAKTHELFSQMVQTGVERRQLRTDLSVEFITGMFLFMISRFNEFLLVLKVPIAVDNLDRIMTVLAEYIEFLERGLASVSN